MKNITLSRSVVQIIKDDKNIKNNSNCPITKK